MDGDPLGGVGLVFVVGGAYGLDDVVLEALGPFHLSTLVGLHLPLLDHLDAPDGVSLEAHHVAVDMLLLPHDLHHPQQVTVSHTVEHDLLDELELGLQFLVLMHHQVLFVPVFGYPDENAVLEKEEGVFPDCLSADGYVSQTLPLLQH